MVKDELLKSGTLKTKISFPVIFGLFFSMGIILSILCSCSNSDKVSVVISGSTAMEKLVDVIAESYRIRNPRVTVTVEYTGSSAGIEAVLAQRADIGSSSRRLSTQEKALGAEETVAAIDGIAVIANVSSFSDEDTGLEICEISGDTDSGDVWNHLDDSDNFDGIKTLTTEQLRGICTGKIRNWQEVGGEDQVIVVVGREAGSGTRDIFEEMLELRDQCAYANELDSTGAVLARVASTPGAIGYVSRDVLNDAGYGIRILAVDGCMPTDANIADGSYQLTRPFLMVTKGPVREQKKEVQELFAYLRSEEGRELVRSVGLIVPEE